MKEANDERDGVTEQVSDTDGDRGNGELPEVSKDNEDTRGNDGKEDIANDENKDLDNDGVVRNDDKKTEVKSSFKPITVKIDGIDVQLNSIEEVTKYVKNNKAKKSQADLMIEQSGISKEDIALLLAAKKVNKNAIAKLAQLGEVDLLDVDEEMAKDFDGKFEVKEPTEVDNVASSILANKELASKFQDTVKQLPQSFTTAIAQNADMLRSFSIQVETGLAEKIIPEAIKRTKLDGGDFMDNYTAIGNEMIQSQARKPKNGNIDKVLDNNSQDQNESHNSEITAEDIGNMSDEEFEKYVENN